MNPEPQTFASKGFWITLIISGLLGVLIGGLWFGTWQVVVESGQALAGTVPYESSNSFYQYHMKAWTIAHQLTAILLWIGLSVKSVCIVVSALLGALVFTAFSSTVYALSGQKWISIAAPFTILSLLGVRANYYYGAAYPIIMFNSHHSNGIMGRNLAIVIVVLLSMNARRSGFLLLGLIPAIHITWGAWTWGVVICWMLWERLFSRDTAKRYGPWFATGFSVTLASFLYQQFAARDLPQVDAETQSEYLTAFYANWDYHRTAISLLTPSITMALCTLMLAIVWLRCLRYRLSSEAATLLRLLVVTTACALIACVFAAYPQVLPNKINMLMVGRFVNISIAILPVLLLGLMASELKRSRFIQLLLAAHFCYLIVNYLFLAFLSSDRFGWFLPHWIEFCLIALLLGIYAIRKRRFVDEVDVPVSKIGTAAIITSMLCVTIMLGRDAFGDFREHRPLINQTSFPVFEHAKQSKGTLIVSGGVQIMQLRTSRPLLINTGGLDQIAFIPSSGLETARMLQDVYGIDFFNPPNNIKEKRPGTLLPESGREVWAIRSPEEWRRIAKDYQSTQVLAPADWTIKLELIITDGEWTLYDLPNEMP